MIDEISRPQEPTGPKPRPVDPSRTGKQPAENAVPRITDAQQDSAQISPTAAEISRYRELARLHQAAYGDEDRSQKLEEVKKRVADGFYNQPETIDELAGRVLEGTLQDAGKADEVSTVERRIRDDFYSRPKVIERTAEEILKQVWPRGTGSTAEDE